MPGASRAIAKKTGASAASRRPGSAAQVTPSLSVQMMTNSHDGHARRIGANPGRLAPRLYPFQRTDGKMLLSDGYCDAMVT